MSTLAPHPAPQEEQGREAAAPGDGAPAGADALSNGAANGAAVNGAAANGTAANGASVNGAAPPAPPLTPVAAPTDAAAGACPQCGATLAPEQEWCLECGHAARRRSLWRAPVLIAAGAALLIGGGVAAAFAAIDGGPNKTVTVATQEQAPRFPAAATPPGAATPPAAGAVSGGAPKPGDKPIAPAKPGASAAATPGAAAAKAPTPATPKGGAPATPSSGSSTPSSGSTSSSGSKSSGSKTSSRTTKKNSPSASRKRKRNATPAAGAVTTVSLAGAGKADPNDQARAGTSPSAVIDGNPSSAFMTKDFTDSTQRPRVGVWVDAGSEIEAKAIEIGTPTPGMTVQVIGGTSTPPGNAESGEYLAGVGNLSNGQRVDLHLDGSTFRYYLVWITALGHEFGNGGISEISLYR